MSSLRIAIVWSSLGPYHVARLEAAIEALSARSMQLVAYRFSELSNTYGWLPVSPRGVKVITLLKAEPRGAWQSVKLASAFLKSLAQEKIEVCFLPSYSPLPNLLCWLVAKLLGKKTVLMTESWAGTQKSGLAGAIVKKWIVRNFDCALVGGEPQLEYLAGYGMPTSKIAKGYDIVDVDYFQSQSDRWRSSDIESLPVQGLPPRYFLSLGRFVAKKNLLRLIDAYSVLVKKNSSSAIPLVLVGEGDQLSQLVERAGFHKLPVRLPGKSTVSDSVTAESAEIIFYPFQQLDCTPVFFSRCEAFILPSLWEEWGLVVNEAMACGAPVVVSNKVGCARDLVRDGINGFTFEPLHELELAEKLEQFLPNPHLREQMGKAAQEIIAEWSPKRFGQGALEAIDSSFTS